MQMLSIHFWIAPSLPETHTENCSYQAIAGWKLFFILITLVKYIAILLKYHLSFTFFEEAHNSGFCLPVLQRAKFPCCGWLLSGCSLPVPSEPHHGSLWPDSSHQLHKRLHMLFALFLVMDIPEKENRSRIALQVIVTSVQPSSSREADRSIYNPT